MSAEGDGMTNVPTAELRGGHNMRVQGLFVNPERYGLR